MATLTYDFEADVALSQPAGWAIHDLSSSGTPHSYVVNTGGSNRYSLQSDDAAGFITAKCTDAGDVIADAIISGIVARGGAANSPLIYLRHDGGPTAGAFNGYQFVIGNGTLYLNEFTNGSSTSLGTAGKTVTPGTYYNFKLEATSTTIRAKLWTGAEPGWDITNTDSSHSSGRVIIGNYSNGAYFDDISIASSDISGAIVQDPLGTLAVAGLEPVVKVDRGVDQSPLGTVGITGYDPAVLAANATPVGEIDITGYDPVVYAGVDVVPLGGGGFAGEIKIASYNPTVAGFPINVYPGLGTLSITGYDPTVLGQLNTAVAQTPLGTVSITGYNPVVTLPNIAAPVGSLTITGYNPTVTATASAVHLYFKFKDSYGTVWTREIDRKPPVVAVTTTYIASTTDEVILADATAGAFNITLPTVTGRNGFTYEIKKTDSSANAVTIVGTIDGDANFDLEVQDESVTLKAGDAAWWII